MKSLFRGSAVIAATILASSFLLSARSSVAETPLSSVQKPKQEVSQDNKPTPKQDPLGADVSANVTSSIDGKATTEDVPKTVPAESAAGKAVSTSPVVTPVVSVAPNSGMLAAGSDSSARPATAGATYTSYTATAYSLPGRTASGMRVTKGLIAADPRVLPLGTRVRLEAGAYSGEYLVADTGGVIRGKKIDIWTPSSREALRFGRRLVKLTVLSYPAKRATSALRKRKA